MKNGQKIINNYFLSTRVTHRRKWPELTICRARIGPLV
jgi:hypothetical protein